MSMTMSRIGLEAQTIIAESSDGKSFLQEEYTKFFRGVVAEFGVEQPFELEAEKQIEFFNTITKRWAQRKQELLAEGKIDESQV